MRRTSARGEFAFVLAVAAAGLALVLVVAFAPWYSPGPDRNAGVSQPEKRLTQMIDDQGAALTP